MHYRRKRGVCFPLLLCLSLAQQSIRYVLSVLSPSATHSANIVTEETPITCSEDPSVLSAVFQVPRQSNSEYKKKKEKKT